MLIAVKAVINERAVLKTAPDECPGEGDDD
jgi:hypothetical protein